MVRTIKMPNPDFVLRSMKRNIGDKKITISSQAFYS
jgi:hypothetical protein